ncbi:MULTISPECIES: efflux RND transporter periplasmic adaptor subunit [Heyndrickxia]|uniref:efflux RND transporter periplasmic adaptor subunit n=1 Tax=Heyndrickxia TaxID=2837504 RepID=UPI000779EA64|nr:MULTISPECIES: biotin/lipoyl-binding protein [Heyndrickxia]KYC69898.1 hypothetical protein B4096_2141 [Heyndrickxia coagulans]MBQ4911440.1 biotin/lipoyl-binding protein [Heyndrickxia faecalis]MDT9756801.1 biotin/lipoyl-binding protein [Heyndrickxia coagulans]
MNEETANGKKNLIIALIIIAALFGVLCLVIVLRTNASLKSEPHYEQYVVKYTPALVETGKVSAKQTQNLQIPDGTVQKVNVRNGDEVKKGDVLLTTHNIEIIEKITEVKQSILKMQRDLAVQKQNIAYLKKKLSAVHQEENKEELNLEIARDQNTYRDTEAGLQNQQDQLNQLENRVEGRLKAPFDGVMSISTNNSGQSQYSISSDALEVQSSVSEYDYDKLRVGSKVVIKALANGKRQTTTIQFISKIPSKTATKKGFSMYDFTVDVDRRFMAGQSVQITIPQKQIKLPSKAIIKKNGQTAVYLVVNGKARFRTVAVEKQNGFYTLKSGLHPGDRIVADPDKRLKDGAKVN